MKLATKIVGVALTAVALCGVGAGTASAATPEGSHNVAATANSTDAPTTTVVAYTGAIDPYEHRRSYPTSYVPPTCRGWSTRNLSSGMNVPNGVKVDGPGTISVTILRHLRWPWRSGHRLDRQAWRPTWECP